MIFQQEQVKRREEIETLTELFFEAKNSPWSTYFDIDMDEVMFHYESFGFKDTVKFIDVRDKLAYRKDENSAGSL